LCSLLTGDLCLLRLLAGDLRLPLSSGLLAGNFRLSLSRGQLAVGFLLLRLI
jgi:hypothetical protein